MAIFDGKDIKSIKGATGPLVFTKQGNLLIVKSKPEKGDVRQTEATKRAASVSGKYISPLAKEIRLSFSSLYHKFNDGNMCNRMTALIAGIIHQHRDQDIFHFKRDSFSHLNGFEFNVNSPIKQSILFSPEVVFANGKLEITLPSIVIYKSIRFPRYCQECLIAIKCSVFNLAKKRTFSFPLENMVFNRGNLPGADQHFSFDVPEGCLVVAGWSIYFKDPEGKARPYLNNENFHPAGIIAAFYRTGTDPEDRKWNKMNPKIGEMRMGV